MTGWLAERQGNALLTRRDPKGSGRFDSCTIRQMRQSPSGLDFHLYGALEVNHLLHRALRFFLPFHPSLFVRSGSRLFVPTHAISRSARAGAVKVGRRFAPTSRSAASRPALTVPSTSTRLPWLG